MKRRPAWDPGRTGSVNSAPHMSAWPRGSNISARRMSSAWPVAQSRLSSMFFPRGAGNPSTTSRRGSPPAWASIVFRIIIGSMSSLIEPGKKAPAFTLKDQQGEPHRLSDYAGKPVVLYFYPKDDTPGCTKETCEFRDNLPRFKSTKAAVVGISILDEASKARFAHKYDVTFPLLADAEHAVAEKYGVWQEK